MLLMSLMLVQTQENGPVLSYRSVGICREHLICSSIACDSQHVIIDFPGWVMGWVLIFIDNIVKNRVLE